MSDLNAYRREREEKQLLMKQILQDQVLEIRRLSRDNDGNPSPSTKVRIMHLQLLEECNSMWDIIPLSKAINYIHEHPPPHLSQQDASKEEKELYELNIPFELGSDEWCFTILLLYKPTSRRIYYENGSAQPLLLMHQDPKEAVIESGIACGNCLQISPKLRCAKCKIMRYCTKNCQASHWEEHKKQCRAGKLKRLEQYSTREQWCKENGSAIAFICHHPHPKLEDVQRMLGQELPPFYTEEMHTRFENVYNFVGKNTFQVYGRELGQFLFDNHGGMDALRKAEGVIPSVIMGVPLHYSDRDEEKSQRMIAEVLARRLLSSSWDGIGSWYS